MKFDSKFGEFGIIEEFRILEYFVTLKVEKIKLELEIGYLDNVEDKYDVVELSDVASTFDIPSPLNMPPRRNPSHKRRRVM